MVDVALCEVVCPFLFTVEETGMVLMVFLLTAVEVEFLLSVFDLFKEVLCNEEFLVDRLLLLSELVELLTADRLLNEDLSYNALVL